MLERLDEIDWSSLTHAYGEASDVPSLIRSLASTDCKLREEALYALYGNVWHQGTVYEATAHAVPFLVELLQHPEVPERHEIIALLRELATGNSYHDVHRFLDWFRNERNTPEFNEKVERELGWVKAAHEAVVDGLDVYLSLLKEEDDQLRAAVPFLLSVCRGHEDRIEPAVHRMATEDPGEQVRASALFCLLRTGEASPAGRTCKLAPLFHAAMCNAAEASLVRLVAAQCWAESTDSEDVSAAVAVARETIPLAEEQYAELLWTDGEEPFSTFAHILSRHRSAQIAWLKDGLHTEYISNALGAIEEESRASRSFSAEITPILIQRLVGATGTQSVSVNQDSALASRLVMR